MLLLTGYIVITTLYIEINFELVLRKTVNW